MSAKKSERRAGRIPSLRRCNGRGFVELNARRNYLGKWGEPETKQAYERAIAEWLSKGRQLPVPNCEITVVELSLEYWRHCLDYYRRPDGTHSSTLDVIKQSLRQLRLLYGDTRAADFGPNSLRAIRNVWTESDLARKTINDYCSEVKRIFKWGASHELIPATVYQSLTTVEASRPDVVRRERPRQ